MESLVSANSPLVANQIGCLGFPGRSKYPDGLSSPSRGWPPSEKKADSATDAESVGGSYVYRAAQPQAPGDDRRERSQAGTDVAPVDHSNPSLAYNSVAAFTETAEKCRAKLLWIAIRVTHRPEEAEDIVQTALLKAFANLSQFRGEAQMSTWLCAIVHNTAREYTRKLYGKVFVSLDSPPCPNLDGDTLDFPEPFMNPEECFERLERVKILSAALEKLSSLHRVTLQLCNLEELPYVRVATALNIRVSTVKSRVLRSKRALKRVLMTGSGVDK